MKFPKEDLKDMLWGDQPDTYEVVKDPEIYETGRWTNYYHMVFKYDGKFYETTYGRGATEYQDEQPYENEPDEIECPEVWPHEVTSTVYKTIKPNN